MDQSETRFLFFAETNQRQSCSRVPQSLWSVSSTCAEEHWVEIVFGQDVPKSKDARIVREPWKISLHRVWPNWILHQNFSGLQINDISFLLSFDYGEIGIFWSTLLPLAGGPKDRKPFDADWRLFISSASFHTSSDNCERNTQKWNSSNRDYKKETIETWKWLRRFCGIKLREAECFATTRG